MKGDKLVPVVRLTECPECRMSGKFEIEPDSEKIMSMSPSLIYDKITHLFRCSACDTPVKYQLLPTKPLDLRREK